MNFKITLVPIIGGLKENQKENNGDVGETFNVTVAETTAISSSSSSSREICLNVKCPSPFVKFKMSILIDQFDEDCVQATFCNGNDTVAIVNCDKHQRYIYFDGFIKMDDEGATVPFVVGPLYSINIENNNNNNGNRKVCDIVKLIESQQTPLKIFINEAKPITTPTLTFWNKFKKILNNFNDDNTNNDNNNNNDNEECMLIENIAKFINCYNVNSTNSSSSSSSNNYINEYHRNHINKTQWIPVLNHSTGKNLLTILFIFKFT
jgi:hypothetical protein